MEIICFFIGTLFYFTHHIFLLVVLLFIYFIKPRWPLIFSFALGALLAFHHQWWVDDVNMPPLEVISDARIEGTVVSIPVQTPDKTQFTFAITTMNHQSVNSLVQLAWYHHHPPSISMGQQWRFIAKIKKPRNFMNPGSFDYVQSLATRHIHWTGYIHEKSAKLLDSAVSHFPGVNVRGQLGNRLYELGKNTSSIGIIEALTLNLTHHMTPDQWDLFRRTGTIHLFGISGEHIALISGFIFLLVKWLWSRSARLCLHIPAVRVASMLSLLAAIGYAMLAGFAPPVQRALIGWFFYTLRYLGNRYSSVWQTWRYALVAIICVEPHVVFMQGFYFSFLAVVCLIITQQRFRLRGFKGKLALQASCLIGLLPLTLYWYAYGSINGLIANLIAIPMVGFLIVPLALITMLLCSWSIAKVLIIPLSWLIDLLLMFLRWVDQLAWLNIEWSIHSIELAVVLMLSVLFLAIIPLPPIRWLSALWLLLFFLPKQPPVSRGEALVRVLDVGQGLAVAIHTEHHTLLYDTGDAFFHGSDLGAMVILPYFKALGIKSLDTVVISHPDRDHQGGLRTIEKQMPFQELLVNDTKYYHRGTSCHHLPAWRWDDVSFRFFPTHKKYTDKNNDSCVLKIQTQGSSMLLTGDIEQIAEDELIRAYGEQLKSEVLLLPHHGSKTSSSYRFILEVAPQFAIASLGFDNRFHFPHIKTLSTLKALGVPLFRTDQCGMIEVNLPKQGSMKKPTCYRG
jgi:competence protein ComEC